MGDWFVGKNHFFAVANTKESRKDEKYRCFLKNREDDYYLGASITPECNSIKTVEKVREWVLYFGYFILYMLLDLKGNEGKNIKWVDNQLTDISFRIYDSKLSAVFSFNNNMSCCSTKNNNINNLSEESMFATRMQHLDPLLIIILFKELDMM